MIGEKILVGEQPLAGPRHRFASGVGGGDPAAYVGTAGILAVAG